VSPHLSLGLSQLLRGINFGCRAGPQRCLRYPLFAAATTGGSNCACAPMSLGRLRTGLPA